MSFNRKLSSTGDLTLADLLVLQTTAQTIVKIWDGPKNKNYKLLKATIRKAKNLARKEATL